MNGNTGNGEGERGRRRLSLALAVAGAALALIGGVLLYARANVFDADAIAERAEKALSDEQLRLALAQPITDAIIDNGPPELVNARPLIESVVTGALGSPPVKAVFGEAVKTVNLKLFQRDPNSLLLNLAEAASIASGAIEAIAPDVAAKVPDIGRLRIELTENEAALRALEVAQDVRAGALILPPLALILLIASVVLAPDRRRGVVRVGLSLAAAAVVGVLIYTIARELLLRQFDDPLVVDAVAAVVAALFGDLRDGLLIGGVLALVFAAAARFTAGEEFDPLAPFVRAGELLRSRPERAWVAVLRALGLGAIGLALVLEPEFSLELVAVVAGAWVLYVGVGELLAVLAPPLESTGEEAPGRRLRPGRIAIAASAVAAVIAIVAVVDNGGGPRIRPPGAPAACNGYAELCAKRIDEIAFPATHNSMSAAQEPGWFLPNQRYGIARQLDDGIRGLLIDTHYGVPRGDGRGFAEVITDLQKEQKTRQEVVNELGEDAVAQAEALIDSIAFGSTDVEGKSKPYLCHVACELGATPFDEALAGIENWMERHPDEFLVIFIEDVVSPKETAQAFEDSGLLRYAYIPDRSAPSPPIGELIEADQRLLVMAENDAGGGKYPWYQQGFDLVQETPYTFNSLPEIESPQSCDPNRGSVSNPLFLLNNWIEKVPRDPALAARINSVKALGGRARMCTRIRGLSPNLLAVDYYDRGNVFGVANELNGLPVDAEPDVRTQP